MLKSMNSWKHVCCCPGSRVHTLHSTQSSPISTFKWHRSNKVRPIHDLSWPPEFSTNKGIDATQCSVSYTSVENIVKFGLMYDEPWTTTIDLKNAYISCKVKEKDKHLLGFSWQRPHHNLEFFSYASFQFGLTSACYLFDQIADSLQLVMKRRGHHPPLHIISMILLVFLALSTQPVLHLTLWNQPLLKQVLKYRAKIYQGCQSFQVFGNNNWF